MAATCRLRGGQIAMGLVIARQILSVLATAFAVVGTSFGATPDSTKSDVERLVSAAAQAEIRGDATRSFALLQDAIRIDPENRAVRWQLGQIRVDNQWVTVEEGQRRAAADPLQTEYRERRAAAGDTPQGQLTLAKWCRKKGLADEALFHWASVLSADPRNDEALRALELHWKDGRLVTSKQLVDFKEQSREEKRAAERWAPKVVKWRRDVSGGDSTARKKSLDEIRAIREIDAIFPLERIILGRDSRDPHHADDSRQIGLAFLEALGKMPAQLATESLARIAVFAPDDSERISAVKKLKARNQHDYVPMLLNGLSMPIESTFGVQRDNAGNIRYTHSLYREGADSDWSADANFFTNQNRLANGRNYFYRRRLNIYQEEANQPTPPIATIERVAREKESRYGRTAAAVESRIASVNQASEALNDRIIPVLIETTGKHFDTAKQWWDYWRNDNEYYEYEHPVDYQYVSGTDTRTYGRPYDVVTRTIPSCFVKGTPVWTKTGRRAIETLEVGDLVLAQDVNTGELKYSPIIGRTVRPPSPTVKLSVDNDELQTTRGHLFWVAGTGWRMAKELDSGERLHGLKGSTELRSTESGGEAEAFNLVIADVGTYFVGDHGFLVHDNTLRSPTRAILPGVIEK